MNLTQQQRLENKLREYGYDVYIYEQCNHDTKDYTFFYQQSPNEEYYNRTTIEEFQKISKLTCEELQWTKIEGCKECIDSFLENLECGGHYTKSRLFHLGNRIKDKHMDKGKIRNSSDPIFDKDEVHDMLVDLEFVYSKNEEKFIEFFKFAGYSLFKIEKCPDCKTEGEWVLYEQLDESCYTHENKDITKYGDLGWVKFKGCKEYVDDVISSLDCGGLYTTMRLFHNGQRVEMEEMDKEFHMASEELENDLS
jgi:hypothetical protein